ncbi:hypothetical protein [Rhodococcus jostii]
MQFHPMRNGVIGRRSELEEGMAGQRPESHQQHLAEIRGHVLLANELGYASYRRPEHHLQIESFEVSNNPGTFSPPIRHCALKPRRMSR